jgi:hypothetical protein
MKDETIRRTLQFFATFVRENDMPKHQIAELLMRADAYIATTEDMIVSSERTANGLQQQSNTLLDANDTLQDRVHYLQRGLVEIVRNANSEPIAADYASDLLSGKDVVVDDGA